jgi:hypothetical protein
MKPLTCLSYSLPNLATFDAIQRWEARKAEKNEKKRKKKPLRFVSMYILPPSLIALPLMLCWRSFWQAHWCCYQAPALSPKSAIRQTLASSGKENKKEWRSVVATAHVYCWPSLAFGPHF